MLYYNKIDVSENTKVNERNNIKNMFCATTTFS